MIDQYEYIIAKEKPDSGGITIEFLNTFGSEGWEAIYFQLEAKPASVVFKRKKKRHLK